MINYIYSWLAAEPLPISEGSAPDWILESFSVLLAVYGILGVAILTSLIIATYESIGLRITRTTRDIDKYLLENPDVLEKFGEEASTQFYELDETK